ncbi:MAG TPA: LysM peptidoglycan-binding domain-containing protein [Gammaproteobacteria bacterium]|nr:LysM peptidoglycan-binding domain-containing protein [Gammaproteobacteria bacterium]
MRRTVAAIVTLLISALAGAEPAGSFPRPSALEPDIQFWIRVYTEVDTRSGFIHDSRDLSVVYETLRFPADAGRRTKSRRIKAAKRRYQAILDTLAQGKRSGLSDEEARVLALWPEDVSNRTLRAAKRRLRFQLGQADKFEAGLARSGIWEAHIREILSDRDLPAELVALPHVESSFNPKARSRVGAAGMWQFTRSTGRRFMRIDRSVDERMDPYLSTVAAAKLLAHNYAATGTWPLAITAYNHGTAGMRRAARKLGTKDITRIVREYNSRRFGFASRNFYVAFLAAVEIHFNAEKYFDDIERHSAPPTQLVRVPDYVRADTLEHVLGIDGSELRELNPALQPSIWRGAKYVPRGFELRIPASKPREEMLAALTQIDGDERYGKQLRDRYYKVRRGNTLDGIARHFEVDVDDLVALNNLKNRHRIRAGQVLALPLPEDVAAKPLRVAEDGKYTVRRGDSVWLIAQRLGIDAEMLVALNDLGDGDRIHVGQVLIVEPEKSEPLRVASNEQSEPAAPEGSESAQSAEHIAQIESPAAEVPESTEAVEPEKSAPVQVALNEQSEPAAQVESESAESAEQIAQIEAPAAEVPEAPAAAAALEVASSEEAETGEAATATEDEASDRSLIAYGAPVSDEARGEAVEDAAPEHHVTESLIAKVEQAEPVTAEEAEQIAPAQPVSAQPDLSADPSDYSVADDETIEVQAAETLGHYAEWLEVRAWDLRRLNGMRYGRPVVIGQRLNLDFSKVSASEFEHRRLAYHRGLQEAFFQRFRIAGTETHVVRRGESLWVLARRTFEIPIWLLRQYNPDLDFDSVDVGVSVTVPKLEPLEDESPAATTTASAGGPPTAFAP